MLKAKDWEQNFNNALTRTGLSTENTAKRVLESPNGQLVALVEGDHWFKDKKDAEHEETNGKQ